MNSQTVNAALKGGDGLGGVLVSHGLLLRTIASTALNELGFHLMSLKQHWLM